MRADDGLAWPRTYRRGVLKTALQPRWLALLLVVIGVSALFVWLGSWQLRVARDRGGEAALRAARTAPPVALERLLQPQQPFTAAAASRTVTVRGSYDPSRQVLIAGRVQRDRVGWWVVTALRTDAGAWLPVVRGWVPTAAAGPAGASAVPPGTVSLAGVLQPDDPAADRPSTLPTGQLAQLDAADLANRWGTPIYNGYLVLTSQSPPSATPQPERVVPPAVVPQGLAWRNAAYAVQWWVFAGFALVLWWKMVRQEQLGRSGDRPEDDERTAVA